MDNFVVNFTGSMEFNLLVKLIFWDNCCYQEHILDSINVYILKD